MSSADKNSSSTETSTNTGVLSKSTTIAIAASISAAVTVVVLCIVLYLRHRRAQRRASLSSIGANNLYDTPRSARSSQIVVTREISRSVSHLPVHQSAQIRASYGSNHSRKKLLRGSQGSTRSQANSLRPSIYASSTRSRSSAPPRPTRPSWQANVLEAELNSHISTTITPPPRSYTPLALTASKPLPSLPSPPTSLVTPPSPPFITGDRASGQIVTTYRHPTPTTKLPKDYATQRVMAQVERSLGANEGMSEVGFRREVYTMYDPSEELGRERWRSIGRGVVLEGEAGEIVEWTRVCSGESAGSGASGASEATRIEERVGGEEVGVAL